MFESLATEYFVRFEAEPSLSAWASEQYVEAGPFDTKESAHDCARKAMEMKGLSKPYELVTKYRWK